MIHFGSNRSSLFLLSTLVQKHTGLHGEQTLAMRVSLLLFLAFSDEALDRQPSGLPRAWGKQKPTSPSDGHTSQGSLLKESSPVPPALPDPAVQAVPAWTEINQNQVLRQPCTLKPRSPELKPGNHFSQAHFMIHHQKPGFHPFNPSKEEHRAQIITAWRTCLFSPIKQVQVPKLSSYQGLCAG